MKKLPRKVKHWAAESFESLEKALILFREEFPSPSEEEKLSLLSYAVPFAGLNRGITDKARIGKANDYVLASLASDMKHQEPDEGMSHSICFLIAYTDAHISFGIFKESKAEDVMEYLSANYEINIPA